MATTQLKSTNGWNLQLETSGPLAYVYHIEPSGMRVFVCRFKHSRPAACARHFAKYVQQAFTPARWMELCVCWGLPEHGRKEVELRMAAAGYVHYNVKRALRDAGYPETQAGLNQYHADRRAA
jgi:hypothetical protein